MPVTVMISPQYWKYVSRSFFFSFALVSFTKPMLLGASKQASKQASVYGASQYNYRSFAMLSYDNTVRSTLAEH